MSQFSRNLLVKHIAPAVDERPDYLFPDLNPEFPQWQHWCTNYFLNSSICAEFNDNFRPYALSILTRSQFIFSGYTSGRAAINEYAEHWRDGAPGIARYLEAIRCWESVFLNIQIIYDLLAKAYEFEFDGAEARAKNIGNRIKHVAEDIQFGRLSDCGAPMWIGKEAFITNKHSLRFDEAVRLIRYIGGIAASLESPQHTKERFVEFDKLWADIQNKCP